MTGTVRYINWIIGVMLLFTISCNDNDKNDPIHNGNSEDGEGEVEMYFLSPQTYSKTTPGSATERSIKDLDILVFKGDEYQYRRTAHKVDGSYRTTLKVDQNLTLYFFVNTRSIVENCSELVEGKSWENDIRPSLIMQDPASLIKSDSLPMWAIKEDVTVVQDVINQIKDIFLLRSVASVDIYNQANTDTFALKSAYLFFLPDKGFIAPSSTIYDPTEKSVSEPQAPLDMTNLNYELGVTEVSAESIAYKLYMYENDASTSTQGAKRYTRLVVGGSYLGGETTYYPVDFLNEDLSEILQVTRNYKYIVNIFSAAGPGFPDPGTASEEEDYRLIVDIIDWNLNEDNELGFDGPDYISLGRKHVYLYKPEGSTNKITMTTTIETDKISMDFIDSGNGTQQNGTYSIWNDRFLVRLLFDDNNEIEALEFVALQDYNPNDVASNKQVLKIYSGRINFEITIEQLNESPNEWIDGGTNDVTIGEED